MYHLISRELEGRYTWTAPGNGEEGHILFRQFKEQRHAHVVLSGSVVLFADSALTEREIDAPINIKLLEACRYLGTIGPGQVAGTLVAMNRHLIRNLSPASFGNGFSSNLSQFSELGKMWLVSGFVTPNSTLLSIPSDQFQRLFTDDGLFERVFASNELTKEAFINGCKQELLLRQTQRLHMQMLLARKQLSALIALQFFEYYLRAEDDVKRAFEDKRYMSKIKVEQLSWLIGLKGDAASKPINNLIEAGLLERAKGESGGRAGHSRSSRFNFDPLAMRDYYRFASDGSHHEIVMNRLAKEYPKGFTLRPLQPE